MSFTSIPITVVSVSSLFVSVSLLCCMSKMSFHSFSPVSVLQEIFLCGMISMVILGHNLLRYLFLPLNLNNHCMQTVLKSCNISKVKTHCFTFRKASKEITNTKENVKYLKVLNYMHNCTHRKKVEYEGRKPTKSEI